MMMFNIPVSIMKQHTLFERNSSTSVSGCTGLARLIVWLNIVLQFLLPLASAFTPAIAHARSAVTVRADASSHTQVYTLARGESVQSVAKKYHLTVEELRKLNQFRTFAHGFSGLHPGDELDVPATLVAKETKDKPELASDVPDEQAQKVAGLASQVGSFLSNGPDGQAAQSLVTGMAVGSASNKLQQVLSRYGTARVQLGVDDNFSLKNSEFDLLLPLWERQNMLLFTQGSVHRTDDRTQSNLGLGLRYFADDWMVGGNTFLDYDLSRDHSRLGFGLEYGRDFMKLSANGYQRLSNWKDSPDVEDYQERPANGWDVRAEGWLPALPQLGGKLVYEQYYGDEVALMDKDHRQRDPHAITVGLNYTPVPLVTLSAERRQSGSDDNETLMGLAMNYQLGVPWKHQIDPNNVAAMHTLNGSRYDLVERNNSIILEYRKQELIRLKTAALVTGNGGERKSLGVSVNSKHGVKQVDWSAATLLAAGGKIIANSAVSYDVQLPAWQSAQGASNTYLISGVAVDSHNNRSAPSETQVTVNAAVLSAIKSTFLPDSPLKSSPADSYLPADGSSQERVTLTLVDDQNQPVDVPLSDIAVTTAITPFPQSGGLQATATGLKAAPATDATVSTFTRKAAGVYTASVTAGTQPELLMLTPKVRQTLLSAARFFIVKNGPDAGQSTFVASPKTLPADNTAVSTLTLAVKDTSGNPLSGVAGSLSVAVTDSQGTAPMASIVTVSSMVETATAGTYTATLKGTKAGTWLLKPLYNGSAMGGLNDSVTLTAGGTPDAGQSAFSASPKLLAADGSTNSTLTLTVKDAGGNVMTGIAGSLSMVAVNGQGSAEGISLSSVTETPVAGTYIATLSGTASGSYTVRPQFSGSDIGSLSDAVVLTAVRTPDGSTSTFSASPTVIAADNIAVSTLTIQAKDVNGNTISGIASSLTLSVKGSNDNTLTADKVVVSSITESATPGMYIATLKGTLAGVYTVKPLFSGSALGSLSASVTLTAGTTPDGAQSNFSASPKIIAADNTATSTLTFSAKDSGGNAISGIAGSLTFVVKDSGGQTPAAGKVTVTSVTESAIPGIYTAHLTGTLAGAYSVKPQFNGGAVGSLRDNVVLTAGTTPDGSQSTFAAAPPAVAADNLATSTLTLVAKDAYGNAVKGVAASLTLSIKDSNGNTPSAAQVTVGSLSESAIPGTYTATLKGTLAGVYSVKPQFSGGALGSLSASVTLTAGTVPDGLQSTFSAAPVSIAADNTATSTLTFTAKDAGGNAVTSIKGSLTFVVKDNSDAEPAAGKVTVGSISETGTSGVYTAILKGTLAGVYSVKPQFSGSALGSLSATVTLTAATVPDGSQSTFSATPKTIAADGSTVSLLTLKVKDVNGNVIGGLSGLTLTVKDSQGQTPATDKVMVSSLTETAVPGTWVATLKGTLADSYTLTPQVNGRPIGSLSDIVTLTAGSTPDGSLSMFSVSPKSIVADSSTTSTLTVVLKDANGNALVGAAGSLSISVTDSQNSTPTSAQVVVSGMTETATAGTYSATLKGTLAGTYTVKPQFNSSAIGSLSDTVTLTAGTVPDGNQSAFSATPKTIAADGTAASLLTLKVKDVNGNAIGGLSGLTLTVKDSQGHAPEADSLTVSTLTETAIPGLWTATLKGTLAGTYTVIPQVNGNPIGSLNDTVTLTAGGTPDGSNSLFNASPKSIAADDSAMSTLTLQVKDASGNAIGGVSGLSLNIKDSLNQVPSSSKVTLSILTETATPGTWTATLKGQLADTYTVTPQLNGGALGSLSDTVMLTAGTTPDAAKSTFAVLPHSIVANNTATSTVLFTAKDTFGNPVRGLSGLSVGVKDGQNAVPAAGKVTVSSMTETATLGVYAATVKGTLADVYTLSPQLGGSAIGSLSDTVTLTADSTPDAANSTFSAAPLSVVADDSSTSTLTLHIQDVNGNAMTGRAGDLTLGVTDSLNQTPVAGKVTLTALTETATPGTYTATLKGQRADAYTVTPLLSGSAIGTLHADVTLTAGSAPSGSLSGFTATPQSIAADDRESSTLILTLRDTFGNAISGQGSSLTLEVKDSDGNTPITGDVTVTQLTEIATLGTYTATLKGKVAGDWTVTPKLAGSAIGILSATVSLTSGTVPDGTQSAFTVTSPVVANNSDMSTLTFTAKDVNGNVVSGIAASLKMSVTDSQGKVPDSAKVTVGKVSETATPGIYIAMLKGTLAGVYTVKPLFNSSPVGSLSGDVTLTAGTTPDAVQSSLTASPLLMTANDTDMSTLRFTAKDEYGNAIAGLTTLALDIKDSQSRTPDSSKVVLSTLAESSTPGVYTATLKGTLVGAYTMTPLNNGAAIGALSVTVILTADSTPDGDTSAFTVSPASIVADDVATSTLTLQAKDKHGNVIPGIADNLTIGVKDSQDVTPAAGKVTVSTVVESTTVPGTYTATLRGQLAGVYTVKPQNSGAAIGSLSDSVTLTAGVPDTGSATTFTASPRSVVADNTATSTLTLTVKDKFGNLISGMTNLTLDVKDSGSSTPSGEAVTVTALTEQGSTGVYTGTLKGTLAGTYTVTPLNNGTAMGTLSDTVILTADSTPDGDTSAFTVSPASIVADDVATSTLTLQAKDKHGNVIPGIADNLTIGVKDSQDVTPAAGKVTVSTVVESTTVPGTYTATLRGQLAGVYTVKPQNSGTAIGSLSDSVTLTAGVLDGSTTQLVVSPDTIVADNIATSTLAVVAKDKFGNAISSIAGSLDMVVKDSQNNVPSSTQVLVSSIVESSTPGIYTANLKGTLAGVYTITSQLSGRVITDASDAPLSKMVTLTAGDPDGTKSTFVTNPKSVAADNTETSTLTLQLTDSFGNPLSAMASSLGLQARGSDGKAPAPSKYTLSGWVEDTAMPGTYTNTIRSTLADTLTLKPAINSDVLSDSLSDTVTFVPGEFKDITSNGATFNVASGFPTTGFVAASYIPGAKFTLNLPAGKTASDYTWVSDQDWVTVNSGVVTFTGDATSSTKTVKVTATLKGAMGLTLQYTFTVDTWYKLRVTDGISWSAGNTYCAGLGASMPSAAQLTSGANSRVVGTLWGEWGTLIADPTHIVAGGSWYKSSTSSGANAHLIVNGAGDGSSLSYSDTENGSVGTACFISL